MPIDFRYVGRKDNPAIITGQQGFCSFMGEFNESVYQEYFTPVPEGAVVERTLLENARDKRREMAVEFASAFADVAPSLPVEERIRIRAIRRDVQDALAEGDIEAAAHLVETFEPPAELAAGLKTKLTRARGKLREILEK